MIPDNLDHAKALARALRATLAETGEAISHSQALERIAHRAGARDWNTLSAALANAAPAPPRPLGIGAEVTGHYLGQPFSGKVLALTADGAQTWRITLHFAAPVNVSRSALFDVQRQRVSGSIGREGRSEAETSDGQPQLVVDLAPWWTLG